MTKTCFFRVFDEAWKICKNSSQNIISGFRKAGLVPFDANALDYSKVIDENKSAREFNTKVSPVSTEQKLGLVRALKCFNLHLSDYNLNLFKKRFDEGYDATDNSDQGQLYKVYSTIRKMANIKDNSELIDISFVRESLPASVSQNSFQSNSEDTHIVISAQQDKEIGVLPAEKILCVDSLNTSNLSTGVSSDEINVPVPSTSTPEAFKQTQTSTPKKVSSNKDIDIFIVGDSMSDSSVSNAKFYGHWEYSPFKKYLKIDESVVISRTECKTKAKRPPAVSGTDYYNDLLKNKKRKETEV